VKYCMCQNRPIGRYRATIHTYLVPGAQLISPQPCKFYDASETETASVDLSVGRFGHQARDTYGWLHDICQSDDSDTCQYFTGKTPSVFFPAP